MSAFYYSIKNVIHRPLRNGFNIFLVAFAVSLILTALLIQEQMNNHFDLNLSKTDLILSAKGSPLQSVLCNIYHADAPTGNIDIKKASPFLRSNHPIIKEALPLSLGDNYKGQRIIGTTIEFFDWYNLSIKEGKKFEKDFDVVIGAEIAKKYNLKIGNKIQSGHGIVDENTEDHLHEDQFTIVGILSPASHIINHLVLTPISTYWLIHKPHDETNKKEEDAHDHSHDGHDHHHHDQEDHIEETSNNAIIYKDSLIGKEGDITSVLLRFKNRNIQSLNFGRNINENTDLMASHPAFELNRLYELTGSISEILYLIAILICINSLISIFISLLQSANERKQEFSIMRLTGVKPRFLFYSILWEGIIIIFIGFILGIILAHLFIYIISAHYNLGAKYNLLWTKFSLIELYVFIGLVILVFLAAIYPAIKAFRVNISDALKSGA